MNESKAKSSVIYLIIGTAILRMILAAWTGLGTGESYYFRGVQNLDLSYFDQPPMFFWLSGLTVNLFGETAFALRLPTVLLFAGSSWMLFLITKRFFSARAGFFSVLILNLSAVFTISIGIWFQPDSPLIFFWLLCTWYVIKILFPAVNDDVKRNSKRTYGLWIMVGLTMGLTTLSKYHVLFLLAGVFLFCLFHKKNKHWIWHPGPYIALILNFVVAIPIFLWNADNNWVSFVFQGSRAGTQEFSLHFDWFFRSIAGQAVWLLPWIWFPLIRQLFITWKKRRDPAQKFFFWMAVIPIVFFTLVTLWSNLQFHFHWQAPGYMMLMPPLGAAIASGLKEGRLRMLTKRWIIASVVFTIVSISVLAAHMMTGFWQSYGPKWVAERFGKKLDPTIDGIDFDEVRERLEKEGWMADTNTFVATPRWWLTGKVDWVLRAKKPILVMNRDPRNFAFFVDPQKLLGKNAVIIGRDHIESVKHEVNPFFDKVERVDDIIVYRGGRAEMKLECYYAYNFKIPENPDGYVNVMPLLKQLKGLPPF